MKKLLTIVLALCCLGIYLKAEQIPTNYTILEKSDMYTLYCVKDYMWIKWNVTYSIPTQMFEYHNGQSVPVKCK